MAKLERPDIEWIAKNSNWGEKGISRALRGHVYADRAAWQRFLSLSTLSLGTAFGVAGIFFFFAHNWDALHRFTKLGLLEGFLILLILGLWILKPNPLAKKVLLLAASLMIGALYAVYGQVYQSGADAYELFLIWALMVLPWTLLANFTPLWLLQIVLLNLALIQYADQGAAPWVESHIQTLLILMNGLLLIAFESLPRMLRIQPWPIWLLRVLALFILAVALTDLPLKIIDGTLDRYWIELLVVVFFLALGLWHGLQGKQAFYPASVFFGIILLISALMLRISDEAPMILAIGLFIVVSNGLLVKTLLQLQRKWKK